MKTGLSDRQQWALLVAMLLGMAFPTQAQTPPITPANDGTGTIVTPDGNQLDISGGSLSGDRANLFHSFSTFGLNEGQIANFLSNPEIKNILGRVVGGDPSYINGLIQVTGGPSNLFLMNPAGILFGNQAQLNVPGDFTATTATGIGFCDTWFNGFGSNEYQALVGTPTAFIFSTSQPGAVVNFGNLGLQPGRDLTLIGGTVLSSGTLTAPGGNITIAAVPGESRVRISQENHLLSLEITSMGEGTAAWGNSLPRLTPLSVSELITGGSLTHAQTVQVNPDGTIALTGSGMNLDSKPGDAIASGIVDVSGETGGNIQMTGDRVAVIQGAIDASGMEGGGTIRLGGDYQGNGQIPNADRTWISPNSTLAADAIDNGSGGTIILWSDNTTEFHGTIRAVSPETGGFVEVSGKETLIVRGSIDVSAENGTSGTILFDPKNIIIAHEESNNNLAENFTLFDNNPDTDITFNVETLSKLSGSVILEANNDIIIEKPIVAQRISSLELTAGRNITINADIDTSQGNGAIILQGNSPDANLDYRESGPASIIQADGTSLNAGSGNIELTLGDLGEVGKIQIGNATTTGEITLNAGGGNILRNSATSLTSADKLALKTQNTGGIGTETAPLRISVTNLEAQTGSGGIFIESPTQGFTIGGVSETLEGIFAENGGDIVLSAEGDIMIAEYIIAIDSLVPDALWIDLDDIYTNLGDLATNTEILDEMTTDSNIGAGNIDLRSINGSINFTEGGISSWSSMDDAGEIYLSAKQDIQLGPINSQGIQSSRNITVNSIMGSINRSNSLPNDNAGLSRFFRFNGVASYSEAGKAGNISLSAAEEIDLLDIFWVIGSEAIQSGNITLKTETGDIRASSIFSSGINNSSQNGSGGDISIVSGGAILVDGSLASSSTDTSGGNITLLATGDIAVGYIDTSGGAAGGDILIESQTAGIANPGWLYSSSPEGNAGNITLISQGDIVSGSIISGSGYYTSAVSWEVFIDGSGIGGDITLISQEGVISIGNGTANIPVWDQLNNGILNAGSGEGRGGNITLSAKGDIQTGEISTTGKLSGGAIELTSSQGAIATGEATLSSASASGNGGPITLSAFGNIQTGNLWSTAYGNGSGGNITLRSTGGNIDTQAGFLDPSSMSSMNGTVLLDAYGNITTHLIPGLVEKVNMNSRQGSIDLLFALAQNITIEDGGTDEWLRNEKTVRNLEVVSDADAITEVIGEVILQAHNDITVNEPIATEAISLLELRAGRSINLNADIDTSATNGNIILRANDPFVIQGLRDPGPGSVNMAPGTTLNAGSGQIDIAIVGKHWEVGDINLGNINTTGRLTVDANEGNIYRVSADSLLSAGSAIFEASVTGGIGTLTDPLRVSIDNIEASAGRGGIYLDSPFQGIIIGGASDLFSGISSLASDISISATGDILFMENEFNTISNFDGVNNLQTSYSSSNISLVSRNGMINTSGGVIESRNIFRNGEPLNITLEAQGDIRTGDVQIVGGQGGGKISLISETGGINTTNGFIGSSDINFNYENPSMRGDDIILKAEENIITGNIDAVANLHAGNIHLVSSTGEINTTQGTLASYASEGNAGNITLEAHLNISTSYLNAQTYGEGVRGGDIILTSRTGAINTTLGFDFSEPENFPNFDIFSSNIMNYRLGVNHNIQTLAPGGTGGNIALSAPQGIITSHINALAQENSGNVTLNSSLGDIKTGVIFSASENGEGGTINVTSRTGDINIHHISTYSNQQIGGDITLWADGEVQINDIASYGPVRSGNVTISSNDSIISTGFIRTLAPSGTTGDIRLNTFGTRGDITTATLSAIAGQDAGDIRVIASDGSIRTGRVESRATQGNSGTIQIIAPYDISTEDINSEAGENSGDIDVNSGDGSVTTENVTSQALSGDAGDVNMAAQKDITTGNISSLGGNNSGNISVTSGETGVATENIATVAKQGTAGNINVAAQEDIQTENLTSSGGNGSLQGVANSGAIHISSQQSSVTTGEVTSQAVSGDTGTLTIVAPESVNTGNLTSNAANNSGNVAVISTESSVSTGNIASIVQQGTAGNINVWALNNIQTGNITSFGGESTITGGNSSGDIQLLSSQGSVTTENITSQALSGDAGDINILAQDDVNTGNLTSSGVNDSGDIAITSTEGSVLTGDIATIAEQGTTGNINVDAQVDINTGTISSDGGEASGNIALNAEGTINTGQIFTNNGIITINGEVVNPLVENLEETLPEEVTNPSGEEASNLSENSSPLESSILSVEDAAQINQATASPESEMSLSDNPLLNSQTNQQILSSLNAFNQTPLSLNTSEAVTQIEQQRSAEFAEHFGDNLEHQFMTLTSVRNALGNIARQTGNQSAIVYMAALPDGLEIIVISAEGQPIRATVASASREELFQVITDYRAELTTPTRRASKSYLKLAQQLYDWLITPIEAELEAQGIDTLLFSMDEGLRGLPIAALHDGQQFLVEKYSLSLIPSVSLMDTRYQSLRGTQVLAMGASTFPSMQPLPAVALELSLITQQLWQGDMFLNEEFTRQNLREQRDRYPYPIIHLATHAEFQFEESEPPFIHLWDNDKLRLEEMRLFRWNNPPVELLVLSACRTAVGDRRAELGFAGLAVSAGVKSALASLWYVSDDGTLSFMTQFYNALEAAPLKAEAIRQAQIALIRGGTIVGVNPLRGEKSAQGISLPPELANLETMDFSHPYYWSGFTLIGSPW